MVGKKNIPTKEGTLMFLNIPSPTSPTTGTCSTSLAALSILAGNFLKAFSTWCEIWSFVFTSQRRWDGVLCVVSLVLFGLAAVGRSEH